jgi:hypothetical protein
MRIGFDGFLIKPVKTVNIVNIISMYAKDGGKSEKSYRLCPEVVSSKVANPGIYKQNIWGVLIHGFWIDDL